MILKFEKTRSLTWLGLLRDKHLELYLFWKGVRVDYQYIKKKVRHLRKIDRQKFVEAMLKRINMIKKLDDYPFLDKN